MTSDFWRVGKSDQELLRAMIEEFHQEHGDPIDPETLERSVDAICRQHELIPTWFICDQSGPVGYVALALGYSIEVGGGDCYIDDLYVRKHARGNGLGTAAMNFILNQARSSGTKRVCLEVARSNTSAKKLYQRIGFAGEDRELLFKHL